MRVLKVCCYKVDNAWVPIRFIMCGNYSIVDEVISNNKQNEILSSDLRSNDMIQNKLRAEFEKYENCFIVEDVVVI